MIVFASDNGTFHGQHRLAGGKGLAYEEASHLPLAIRVPPSVPAARQPAVGGRRADRATSTSSPTFVDWSGTETCPEVGDCRVMDGRSLLPLIDGVAGLVARQPPDRH